MRRRTRSLSPDGWVTSTSTVTHPDGSMAYWRSRHSPCCATPSSGQLEAGILSFGRHALGVDAEMELQGNAGRRRRSRVSLHPRRENCCSGRGFSSPLIY